MKSLKQRLWSETWLLKESIAKENRENAQRQIEKLESQIEELEPKTQVHENSY